MALACRICIAKNGLRGGEIESLPQTEEELWEHMETVHHLVVLREGETEEDAIKRFLQSHPDGANCAECKQAGAPWASGATL